MNPNGSLIDHERTFDDLVQSLAEIDNAIDSDQLLVLFANSLPVNIFGNWIQSQMAFIDKMTITEFKGRVRKEARCLNTCGLSQNLGVDKDPDTIQANVAQSRIFPPTKAKGHMRPLWIQQPHRKRMPQAHCRRISCQASPQESTAQESWRQRKPWQMRTSQ